MSVIAINNGSEILINDLGLILDATSSVVLSDSFTHDQIYSSLSLKELVSTGRVLISDGTNILSPTDALDYLVCQSKYGNISTDQMQIINNEVYLYDESLGKWLGSDREIPVFGKYGYTKNQYLYFYSSIVPSNLTGYPLNKPMTIIQLTARLYQAGTCDIHIRKNFGTINIATLQMIDQIENHDNTLNIDVDEGDTLHVVVQNTTPVYYPIFKITLAPRMV